MSYRYEKQVFEELSNGFFTALQAVCTQKGSTIHNYFTGHNCANCSQEITQETLFDLASLTKALFITPLYYMLFERQMLSPGDLLSRHLPGIHQDITLSDLLSHKSGYPAYIGFFDLLTNTDGYENRKESIISTISNISEQYDPVYSDLNYILLGFLAEKIFEKRLDTVFQNYLFELGVESSLTYAVSPLEIERCAATMFSEKRGRICHGEVEDENCFFLGSASGHAGLFGSALDIASLLSVLMKKEWFHRWIHNLDGAGFDRPSGENSNYGKAIRRDNFGHLGFTGTAFLINPSQEKCAVILTNRTHTDPDKPRWKERIKQIRQSVFNEIYL